MKNNISGKRIKTVLKALCCVTVLALTVLSAALQVFAASGYEISCPAAYAENYVIKISKIDDLARIANEVNSGENDYVGLTLLLTASIRSTSDSYLSGLAPIGTKEHPFRGTFDGNGYSVPLKYTKKSNYRPKDITSVALFGYTENAVIRNVTVSGSIESEEKAAGIVANAVSTQIYNCVNSAALTGKIVGSIAASVSGTEQRPSVVGNCINKATSFTPIMTKNYSSGFGGIVGRMEDEYTFVRNCFNPKDLSDSGIGALVGRAAGSDPARRVENSYYVSANTKVHGICGAEDATGYSTRIASTRVSQAATTEGSLSFLMNRYIELKGYGDTYGAWSPSGTTGKVASKGKTEITLISSANDWNTVADASQKASLDGVYILGADISGVTKMLGSEANPFKGVLLGAGHSVTANITFSNKDNVGLISYSDKATVHDVTVKGSIRGGYCTGGIVGRAVSTRIEGCVCAAKMYGTTDLGGIAGMAKGKTLILNCVCAPVGEGSGFAQDGSNSWGGRLDTWGGIAAETSDDTVIRKCRFLSEIPCPGQIAGGIVALMLGKSSVIACDSCGLIQAGTDNAGGIIGDADGGSLVEGCYSQSVVRANKVAGGVVGLASWSGGPKVRNCINVGYVTSTNPGSFHLVAPFWVNNAYLYAIDLTKTDLNKKIGSGTVADLLADYFNHETENADYENPTYWKKGDDTSFERVETRPDQQFSMEMLSAEPYVINNIDDYTLFSAVGGLDSMNGKTWELTADLDVGDLRITGTFAGTLIGNGHTLKYTSTDGGLFLEVRGTVNDLTVAGSVESDGEVGGIADRLIGGTLSGCKNKAKVKGKGNATGGIAGLVDGGIIRGCVNGGEVSGCGNVGGIFGLSRGNVSVLSCDNDAIVRTSGNGTGGIGGGAENGSLLISSCENLFALIPDDDGAFWLGGILGYAGTECDIEYCFNRATVYYRSKQTPGKDMSEKIGGILGGVSANVRVRVFGCGNFGEVTDVPDDMYWAWAWRIGGIVGDCSASENVAIEFCVNDAHIYGMDDIGGIVGNKGSAFIDYCYNAGLAEQFNSARYRELALKIPSYWNMIREGTISGTSVSAFEGHVFTSMRNTEQLGGAEVANLWVHGLDNPAKTLEYLLNFKYRNSAPFGWSVDSDGHCGKAEWSTIAQELVLECSAENPYVISDMGTYRALQVMIAGGYDFAGQYVRLDCDLTVSSALIVPGSAFCGVFDGNGKTITLDENGDGRGFFGDIEGATVKNLKVTGNIKAGNLRGGFASTATATSFENCESSVSIGTAFVGDDCGGFAGIMNNCVIIGCKSTATVYGANRIGGFAGAMYGGTVTDITSEASQNTGNGIVFGWENVGGFAGKATDLTVQGAKLKPIVLGSSFVGGLIGDAYNCVISSCTVTTGTDNNKQWIYTTTASAGGLVGITCNSEIHDCKVFALVWSMGNAAGGIAGTCYPSTKIYRCTVEGGIYGYDRVGGVVGEAVNTGSGGLIDINECTVATKNTAEPGGYVAITSRWSAGGIIGYTNAETSINYCVNSSAIWSDNSDSGITPYVGGIVAYSEATSLTVKNCLNEGYLEAKNGMIGGIVAHARCAYFRNDVNTGTMRRAKYFAGIVYDLGSTDIIKNCASSGEVDTSYSGSNYASLILFSLEHKCEHCAMKTYTSGMGGYWLGGVYIWRSYVPYAEMALFLNNGISDAAPESYDWIKWEHDDNSRLHPQKITASRLKGNGTESSPYLLSDNEDFEAFASLFNTGEIPGNVYVRVEKSFTTFNFIPIGTEQHPFEGHFDGAGFIITISVKDRPTHMNGILGYTKGATVHDVEIRGDMVRVGSDSGMLIGIAMDTTVTDCACGGNFSTVPDALYCGSLVGSAIGNTKIERCIRGAGHIDQLGRKCGALVGSAADNAQIIDCINECDMDGSYLGDCGGIVGNIYGKAKVIRCRNYGDLRFTENTAGGICGLSEGSAQVIDCRNYGNIVSFSYTENIGGIVGSLHGNGRVERCVNEGTITVNLSEDRIGAGRVGGIVGISDYHPHHTIQIVSCTNNGNIVNSARTLRDVGGIVGYSTGTLVACVNNGDIEGNAEVGGIIGFEYFDPNTVYKVSNPEVLYFCINTGKISGNVDCGAFYGGFGGTYNISDNSHILACVSGNVSSYGNLDYMYANCNFNPRGCVFRMPGIGKDGLPTTVFMNGMGTEKEPFIISDIRELNMLAFQTGLGNNDGFEGVYFKLDCDLTANDCLIPIGLKSPFKGIFDGNGKTVEINFKLRAYKVSNGAFSYNLRVKPALFAATDGATVKNIRVSGNVDGCKNEVVTEDADYVGGLVATSKNSKFSNCQVDARVRGGNSVVGGIAGSAENTVFENCICRSEVEGNNIVGGIVGEIIGDCSFVNCIGSALVRSTEGTAGGFAGSTEKAGNVEWNGNFLVTGRTPDKAIAIGNGTQIKWYTAEELTKRSELSPYYRVQETGICLSIFYVSDPHGRTDAFYPGVSADYVRDGSLEYFRCNSCGKYFTDRAHQHEIEDFGTWNVIIPKFDKETTYEAGIVGGNIERFRTVGEFLQYLTDHRTSEFRHISLGGDLTTSFPVIVKCAVIYLHGHTWMTTGEYEAAIVDRSPIAINCKYTEWETGYDGKTIYYHAGGGTVIYGDGGMITSDGNLHSLILASNVCIRDTTLCGAKAENGGAICADRENAQAIELFGCIIHDCEAINDGGAINMFAKNKQTLRIQFDNSEIYNCVAGHSGGAVYMETRGTNNIAMFRFINGSIHECKALYGGAIYICGGYYARVYGDEPVPSKCRIEGCQALGKGGAVYAESDRYVRISGIEMIGNYTSAFYGSKYSLPLYETVNEKIYCEGGAIFFDAPDAVVYADNFALNSAGYVGGAISCSDRTATLTADNCRFYLDVVSENVFTSQYNYGFEIAQLHGKLNLNNISVKPVFYPNDMSFITSWFATSDPIVNITEMSKNVHVNNSITGASTIDNASLGVVITTAVIGIVAMICLTVYGLKKRKNGTAESTEAA